LGRISFGKIRVDAPDKLPVELGFRIRGAGMSRIDVFSDVVFGLALVLLVLSLVVPKNHGDLHESIPGFVPFAVCFVMLLAVWSSHYTFFRRYGLHDQFTIILNSGLLFVVLFCVYPLKILVSTISEYLFRDSSPSRFTATVQINGVLALYALGFTVAFFLVAALYWNAWRQRGALGLNGLERLLTVSSIVDALGLAAIGLISALAGLILPPSWSVYSASLYFLIAPWKTLNGLYFGRKARTLRKLVAAPTL
jgi:Endosomal/lysosomal potassium channel TMEM175